MSAYATLEEALDAARENFLESVNGASDTDTPDVRQFNLQKYVMQDGNIMWQAEFSSHEGEQTEGLNFLSGEAAQAVFDDDFDKIELLEEWQEEHTLYEWDEGEYQLKPQLDTEEGATAAQEWDDEDDYPGPDDEQLRKQYY